MNTAGLLFAALVLVTSAHGATPAQTDCIYDYRMITDQECGDYRAKVLGAKSDEERLTLLNELRKVMDARARERGVLPDDWRGLAVAPLSTAGTVSGRAMDAGLGIAIFIAGLAAMAAAVFFALRTMWRVQNMRLMRCPETGAVAFVGAESVSRGEGTEPGVTVRSCELWPERKDCARGCLERYEQTAPGFRIRVEALRPFDGA